MSNLLTFTVPVTISLSQSQLGEVRRAINIHYLGDEQVNIPDENGRLVAKYPDKESQELRDAHHRIGMTRIVNLFVQINADGDITVVGIEQ